MKKGKTKTAGHDWHPTHDAVVKAREAKKQYTFVVAPDGDCGYLAWSRELPTVLASGDSPDESLSALGFALETALAALLEDGEPLPPPFSRANRTEQVNIRLTPYEKEILTQEAARRGFRGLGDLIRTHVIESLIQDVT